MNFCVQKAGGDINSVVNLTIFPGTSYGHIEFNSVENAMKIMKVKQDGEENSGGMDAPNCANIEFPGSDNV